ncbi:hypothetical protein [Rhizobium sp. NLR22b]|uniref:hypothetical protein n=1 Tax=Rhizobium sp. NLR22b TaxID=2731115 RepID=UPI002180BBA0|nr:hypothetical protein [Rhizobium sp. NLR22b]
MMKRIGGCPACFFCPAACEGAAPSDKFNKRTTSTARENRCLKCQPGAKRTIKSPQLYMMIRLSIASCRSKPDFDASRRPGSSGAILFLRGAGRIPSYPAAAEVKDTTTLLAQAATQPMRAQL